MVFLWSDGILLHPQCFFGVLGVDSTLDEMSVFIGREGFPLSKIFILESWSLGGRNSLVQDIYVGLRKRKRISDIYSTSFTTWEGMSHVKRVGEDLWV